jgi:hypothetical protein
MHISARLSAFWTLFSHPRRHLLLRQSQDNKASCKEVRCGPCARNIVPGSIPASLMCLRKGAIIVAIVFHDLRRRWESIELGDGLEQRPKLGLMILG